MSVPPPDQRRPGLPRAEFDLLADEYEQQHRSNVAISGEEPAFFAEYKVADLADFVRKGRLASGRILDFGCGIGNSVPFFRKHFPDSRLCGADVSPRSIEIARSRFPGSETYLQIDDSLEAEDDSFDIVFSACVFHHIPHADHRRWLVELLRVTRPTGLLAIYEHNPLNPLTVRAVNTCPLDVNAELITAATMRRRAADAGWGAARRDYRLFFPSALRALRDLEPHLGWLPLGAQYRLIGRKCGPADEPR